MADDKLMIKGQAWTPGPWRACRDAKCSCRQVWSMPGDAPVFTARPDSNVNIGMAHHKWGDAPAKLYGEIPVSEMQANTRLIAAAPDLYTALEAILLSGSEYEKHPRYSVLQVDRSNIEQARAALAKATVPGATVAAETRWTRKRERFHALRQFILDRKGDAISEAVAMELLERLDSMEPDSDEEAAETMTRARHPDSSGESLEAPPPVKVIRKKKLG